MQPRPGAERRAGHRRAAAGRRCAAPPSARSRARVGTAPRSRRRVPVPPRIDRRRRGFFTSRTWVPWSERGAPHAGARRIAAPVRSPQADRLPSTSARTRAVDETSDALTGHQQPRVQLRATTRGSMPSSSSPARSRSNVPISTSDTSETGSRRETGHDQGHRRVRRLSRGPGGAPARRPRSAPSGSSADGNSSALSWRRLSGRSASRMRARRAHDLVAAHRPQLTIVGEDRRLAPESDVPLALLLTFPHQRIAWRLIRGHQDGTCDRRNGGNRP